MNRLTINAEISARILNWMNVGGLSLKEAFDKVLGVAAYDCLAYELYDALTGEAA